MEIKKDNTFDSLNDSDLFFNQLLKKYGTEEKVKVFLEAKLEVLGKLKDKESINIWGKLEQLKRFIDEGMLTDKKIKEKEETGFEIFGRRKQAYDFIKNNPVYYDKNKIWWCWDKINYRWEITDETELLNKINKTSGLNTIENKTKTEIIEALKQVGREKKPKEIKKTWIQFKDKIIDIESGEKMKATPEYFVTNPIPYSLNENNFINTPVMDRIFEEWVGKEYVQTLYEIISYCLLPDYPLNRLFCFIGSGMNGKSCFLNLIQKFLGGNNCNSTELDNLLGSRFELARLHKKLVCMVGETNFNEMKKTSMLKKLTGGDLIGFEYKGKDLISEYNYAKILISTNNLPTTDDKSIGFYRRWLIIDFPNQFSEKKDILAEIPEEEYEILAIKCTLILKELLKERKFTNEGEIEDRKLKFESKSDFLQKFLEEFTEEAYDEYITCNNFKVKFKDWCRENRHREMSDVGLGQLMKKKDVECRTKKLNWMNNGAGGTAKCYMDLRWK